MHSCAQTPVHGGKQFIKYVFFVLVCVCVCCCSKPCSNTINSTPTRTHVLSHRHTHPSNRSTNFYSCRACSPTAACSAHARAGSALLAICQRARPRTKNTTPGAPVGVIVASFFCCCSQFRHLARARVRPHAMSITTHHHPTGQHLRRSLMRSAASPTPPTLRPSKMRGAFFLIKSRHVCDRGN